jgi:hypothetical protein
MCVYFEAISFILFSRVSAAIDCLCALLWVDSPLLTDEPLLIDSLLLIDASLWVDVPLWVDAPLWVDVPLRVDVPLLVDVLLRGFIVTSFLTVVSVVIYFTVSLNIYFI